MSSLMMFFIGFVLYGCSTLLPLLVQTQFGYDATLAGLVLSPSGIALIVLMPFVGKLATKIQARYQIALGMLIVSIGMELTAFITPQTDFNTFILLRTAQVIGLPLLFVPSSVMAFSTIPSEKSSKASALYSLLRNLGGSMGISLLLSDIARHQQSHQSNLAEHLTPSNPAFTSLLAQYTQALLNTGHTLVEAALMASAKIYEQLINQSYILAYADAFRYLAVITLVLAFIALLMPGNLLRPKTSDSSVAIH